MLEVLSILELKKHRIEAELAGLTRKSSKYFKEISNISEGVASKKMDVDNLYVLEKWRDNQIIISMGIIEKLELVQNEIITCKQNYKKILAQNLAAKDMANRQYSVQTLQNEEQETSRALDIFFLSRHCQEKLL